MELDTTEKYLDIIERCKTMRIDELVEFEKQMKDYFRTDIKLGYKLQTKGVSQSFIFYIQNVTDHKNILIQSLDKTNGVVINEYQLGFFPVVLYRIEF